MDQNEMATDPDFRKNVFFWLDVYINKQNYHIWSDDNPQAILLRRRYILKKSLFGVLFRRREPRRSVVRNNF